MGGGSVIDEGESSFTPDGVGHVSDAVLELKVKAKLKGSKAKLRAVPGALRKALNARLVGRVSDGETYPDASGNRPLAGKVLAAGVSNRDKRTKVCLRLKMDSRPDAPKKASRFKVMGGTGAAAKLRAKGTFPRYTMGDTPNKDRFKVSVKKGGKRKLPGSCRKLLKLG